jgi:hypothetical protein
VPKATIRGCHVLTVTAAGHTLLVQEEVNEAFRDAHR